MHDVHSDRRCARVVTTEREENMKTSELLGAREAMDAAAAIAGPYCGMSSRCEPRIYDDNPDRSRGAKAFHKKKARRKMAKASRRLNRKGR